MGCILGNQYIPSIAYFAHWLSQGSILLEAHEHYQKRSWRNKTCILGTDGPQALTIPLQKGKHQQMQIQDVQIAYDEDWAIKHLRSIKTAYGKTAFAEEVISGLEPILTYQYETLWEMNLACLKYVTILIKGDWPFELTKVYQPIADKHILDLRNGVSCGDSPNPKMKFPEYAQALRIHQSHLPNLSILDPLCHLGPGTYDYLARYANKLYEKP